VNFQSLQLALCAFNWGAICFVQAVHYPLFADVPETVFTAYHRKHVQKTTLLLGFSLTFEMLLNIFLMDLVPLLFLGIGWGITFFVSVPQHRKLEKSFSEKAFRTLLNSNWGRVLCWGCACIYDLIGL